MSSLKERISLLEADLTASPPRISTYEDFPFAILRYEPPEVWKLQKELKLFATRLKNAGKEVVTLSLADLFWQAIEESEGRDVIFELERERGFEVAQDQISVYLSDPDFCPLPDLLAQQLHPLRKQNNIAFLLRAEVFAPSAYHVSKLLDEMKGKTEVNTILFYPGSIEGTHGLRFMDLRDREPMGNYRVKIYG